MSIRLFPSVGLLASAREMFRSGPLGPGTTQGLNPQPLPPKDRSALNPQPLPPKDLSGLKPEPLPPRALGGEPPVLRAIRRDWLGMGPVSAGPQPEPPTMPKVNLAMWKW